MGHDSAGPAVAVAVDDVDDGDGPTLESSGSAGAGAGDDVEGLRPLVVLIDTGLQRGAYSAVQALTAAIGLPTWPGRWRAVSVATTSVSLQLSAVILVMVSVSSLITASCAATKSILFVVSMF